LAEATLGLAIVLGLRLTVPLTILRWPLAGGVLAILVDTVDILFFQTFGFPSFIGYHEIDKLLDSYYLVLEVIVVQRWPGMPRGIASVLFIYRMIGVAILEVTDARGALVAFPNLFEFYFLFYAACQRFAPEYRLTAGRTAGWLVILLIPKMGQEYVLHGAKLLDHAVAKDIIVRWYHHVVNVVAAFRL
jgi:hypothetical protein